jgi:hypothetical protein
MSSYTRRLQQRIDGHDEPDRDDIDEGIARRKALARQNLRIFANRISAGDEIEDTLRAVYNGNDPLIKLAADIRRVIT